MADFEDEEGTSLPVYTGSVLQRTSSPANPGASPSGLGGAGAAGKSIANTATDAKGKGKKRKAEAAGGAAGEEGGTPAKKKKKPAQPKKPAEKKNEGEGSKTPSKGGPSEQNQDKDGNQGDDDGDGKDPKDEAGEDDEDVEDGDDDLALDDKYKQWQEEKNRQFQEEVFSRGTKSDWDRYTAMRRANLNEKETKAMIASLADMPESQLKGPIVFTLKGMAKVLVGQLVDNARVIRREWGEDSDPAEPLQPRHILESHRRMMCQGAIPPNTSCVSPFSFRR